MLWTKRANQCTIFQTFECSNESLINSLNHFWNRKVRVCSNSASLFSVMKDDSCSFLGESSCTSDKNSPSKWMFWTFEWLGGLNFKNPSSQFFFKLCITLMSWEVTLLYFFSQNFIWFLRLEPTSKRKISDFWLLMSHDTDEWCTVIILI